MQASFTLTEGEYVKANQLFTKPSRKTLFIYAVAGIALATIALGAGSPALRIGAIGALVGGIFGHLFVRRIYAPSQTRKQYKAYKAAQEPQQRRWRDGDVRDRFGRRDYRMGADSKVAGERRTPADIPGTPGVSHCPEANWGAGR